ncbi:MAG TPA: polysaccharide biosynthesis protein, partial [Pyrinomonadaceae bacterium]|nr:polysaccharide biosynthesis protein [Pyrinomonadaceae bacterium]
MTITLPEMTRFLLSLDKAVDTVFAAVREGQRGETSIPQVPAARVVDAAQALMQLQNKEVEMVFTGIRPGEKVHEIMVSEEECFRTSERNGFYVIHSILPELRGESGNFEPALNGEYSSANDNISIPELQRLLAAASDEIASFK